MGGIEMKAKLKPPKDKKDCIKVAAEQKKRVGRGRIITSWP